MKRVVLRAGASGSVSGRAALAVARASGVPPRVAKHFTSAGGVLPLAFSDDAGQALATALQAAGVPCELVEGPPTASRRCDAHRGIEASTDCTSCQAPVCGACAAQSDPPTCQHCLRKKRRAIAFRNARVAVLLMVFVGVVLWGVGRGRRLDRRTSWERPVRVSLVLVATRQVTEDEQRPWLDATEALQSWFTREWARHREPSDTPMVQWQLEAPATVTTLPAIPADTAEAVALGRLLDRVDRSISLPVTDATVYVVLARTPGQRVVEGVGEAGGRRGLVFGVIGDKNVGLETIAAAHELLHCLGATDKYDAEGHAQLPQGLVDPNRSPLFPQDAAEVMVGERPTAENAGETPRQLDDVQVGPATAAEIRWVK